MITSFGPILVSKGNARRRYSRYNGSRIQEHRTSLDLMLQSSNYYKRHAVLTIDCRTKGLAKQAFGPEGSIHVRTPDVFYSPYHTRLMGALNTLITL